MVTHEVTCAIQAQRERHWNGNSPSSLCWAVVIVSVVDVDDGGDLEELWNESHPFVEEAKQGDVVVYRA